MIGFLRGILGVWTIAHMSFHLKHSKRDNAAAHLTWHLSPGQARNVNILIRMLFHRHLGPLPHQTPLSIVPVNGFHPQNRQIDNRTSFKGFLLRNVAIGLCLLLLQEGQGWHQKLGRNLQFSEPQTTSLQMSVGTCHHTSFTLPSPGRHSHGPGSN